MPAAAFATVAAAIAAGYKQITTDRGASAPLTRYFVVLEKATVGGGGSGGTLRAYGEGSSQVNAESQALSGLNKQRLHRYGGSPGRADADANSVDATGTALTTDLS